MTVPLESLLAAGQVAGAGLYVRASNVTQSLASGSFVTLACTVDDSDVANVHFTSDANLTGTVAKTSGSAAIVGTGTAFTTELTVGQVISVPGGAAELFAVASIADNTHLTAHQLAANTSSGQTAARVSGAICVPRRGMGVVAAYTIFDTNGAGDRWLAVTIVPAAAGGIGSAQNVHDGPSGGGDFRRQVVLPHVFVPGDIVTASARQGSGGALNVTNSQLILALA